MALRASKRAVDYVAAQLALAGIAPASSAAPDAGALAAYFQTVPLREITKPSGSLTVETKRNDRAESRTFARGIDWLAPRLAPVTISGPVVFAGYGIREAQPARDDYRDLDVKDKVVVLLAGTPSGAEWQPLREKYAAEGTRQRFEAKARLAASLGARAVLAVESTAFAAARIDNEPDASYFVPLDARDVTGLPPVLQITDGVLRELLDESSLGADDRARPRPVPGATVTIRVGGDERYLTSRNVIGVIRGADSTLRDEAVVLGAHVDHLGRIGGRVHPGADDNASGVSALLEMARALASAGTPPRRSVVFCFWTGEEEGHLGSFHYVNHPLWPMSKTTVYLNLDMIAHPWLLDEVRQLVKDTKLERGDEFVAKVDPARFLELGVTPDAPQLDAVLKSAARGTAVALHLDRTSGYFGGSDYRDFARHGVPFVRFFGNYFPGYHEPIDVPEKTSAAQIVTVAKLALASAWQFANPIGAGR